MAFTEFYVRSGGSALNSGSTNTDASTVTTTNGDWNQTNANRFIAASGTPFSSTIVGDWASIYIDGAISTTLVGRITAVDSGGTFIDVSTTARVGSTTASATGRTCKVGGAFNIIRPFDFISNACINATGDTPRVNIVGGTTYDITATLTHTLAGPIVFQGCTSTPADRGRAVIDGGNPSASYNLISISGSSSREIFMSDLELRNNGTTTGTSAGLIQQNNNVRCVFQRITSHGMRGEGIRLANGGSCIIDCEAYDCNKAAVSGTAGIYLAGCIARRCISHHHTASNTVGFSCNGLCSLTDCIASENTLDGFLFTGSNIQVLFNCTAYGNGRDGVRMNQTGNFSVLIMENCLLESNSGYGIRIFNTPSLCAGTLTNNAFYSNSLGVLFTNSDGNFDILNSINLSSSGMIDPANGNFSPKNTQLINGGYGTFLQAYYSLPGNSYRSIGAVECRDFTMVKSLRRVR